MSNVNKYVKFTALMILAAITVLPCRTVNAQIYKFQQYSTNKGLCHPFVYSIAQDRHGFIWFATGLGLCRYDGFRFTSPDSDELPSANVTTSFRDKAGNLWFGYNDGLTVKYDGMNFSVADTSASKTAVAQIIQAPSGEILVATQTGGITRISDKGTERIEDGFGSVMITAMCFAGNDKLLVGTFDGLYLYSYGSEQQTTELLANSEELSYLAVTSITPRIAGSGYWVATDEDGIYFVTLDGNSFKTFQLDIPEIYEAQVQVQSVYEDTQENLWISTFGKGLVRVHFTPELNITRTNVYNIDNGMGSDYVKQVFFDNQQNLWVATSGNGVAGITNLAFSFFDGLNPLGGNVTAALSVDDSEYWIAGMGAIIRINRRKEQERTILGRNNGLPNDKITALGADDNGDLWIGTESSGLYKLPKNTQNVTLFYREENSLSNTIQNFVFDDGKIWMATRNGVLVIDAQTREKTGHYTTFDGGLPHNNIRNIFKDSKNRILIAANSNSLIDVKNDNRIFLEDDTEVAEFSTIAEDEQGRIWAGTGGRGVFIFDEARDTVYHITVDAGLKADYCYAMTFDGAGQMWVGHRLGLSSINTKRLTINTLGVDNGIHGDVNPLAMMFNKSGEMLVGMTDGAMLYDVKADNTHEQIPMLNLLKIIINDRTYSPYLLDVTVNDKSYSPFVPLVLPYGRYKLVFDFVGLQYSDPNSVSYQYYLQGYDLEWTSVSKLATASYPRLEDGDYNFWVKACNNDNCTGEMMLFTIKVRNPFWKTWWFMLLMIATLVGLVYAIIRVRERNHRIQQEYLEKELQARTREVHRQKEEIEHKNKDITDSINYARRIQFSILPTASSLAEHCTGAFIFYQPRDIVSGDFYWFDYFQQDNRLLIVCADSTGHGVPGAFMSLIGTTLIKDIVIHPDVHNPSDFLYRLDYNIQTTLNRNRETEHANDGMDLIVCEINTETQVARIASAMRTYVIYRGDEATVYKGSRSSIGGHATDGKVFETREFQLEKGDTIYMFTDGYADQFGGPAGKKLNLKRLQNILADIHSREMNEQLRVVRENFLLWKGDMEQTDDVLMIGVKL